MPEQDPQLSGCVQLLPEPQMSILSSPVTFLHQGIIHEEYALQRNLTGKASIMSIFDSFIVSFLILRKKNTAADATVS